MRQPLGRCLSAVLLAALSVVQAWGADPPRNLLLNPGFEGDRDPATDLPTGWQPFSTKLHNFRTVKGVSREGQQSMRLTAQQAPTSYLGLFQSLNVEPRQRLDLSAWAMEDAQDPLGGSAKLLISMEFMDANGREVGRFSSRPDGQLPRGRWTQMKVSTRAPPYSAVMKVVICLHEGEGKGRGSVFVDDVSLVSK